MFRPSLIVTLFTFISIAAASQPPYSNSTLVHGRVSNDTITNSTKTYLDMAKGTATFVLSVPRDNNFHLVKDLWCYTLPDPATKPLSFWDCSQIVFSNVSLFHDNQTTFTDVLGGPCVFEDEVAWSYRIGGRDGKLSNSLERGSGRLKIVCCGDGCPMLGIGWANGD